jgi:flagellar basal-body rod protein FlgF
MERGLYAAASAMVAQQTIQDVIAQNIANATTVGYKQDVPTFRSLTALELERLNGNNAQGVPIGELGTGVMPDRIYTDWSVGPIEQTGNPLDASLGPGLFFAVNTPAGERYTRAGNFRLDGQGNLYTAAGFPVLDDRGQPINVGRGPNVAIDRMGNVTVNNRPVARLRIVRIDPNFLQKQGDSLFALTGGPAPVQVPNPQVLPGTLEQSNVNVVTGLVDLIVVQRNYEMAQKAILTHDELLKQTTNNVGSVS